MEIARGDLVVAAFAGDYGKPRPALVAQSDAFSGLTSVTLLPLTTDLRGLPLFRLPIEPTRQNGLRGRSDVMVDKAATVSRNRIGRRIGSADPETMRRVDAAFARFLGLL
ncbi:MAG: type II toxin-antitoxin system PemK/MazF family toxin [Stellaceae bacterium]